jgi:hypothetical protein
VLISVYIDESGTHGAPLMIMAGFVGKLGQWADFDRKWRSVLKRFDVDFFHARKVRQSKDRFKGWRREKKASFVKECAKIADRHTLFGFTTMVRKDDYEQYYLKGPKPNKARLDSMYGICFRRSLSLICNSAPGYLGRDDLKFQFVLEEGHKNAGDAVRIFNEIKNGPNPVGRTLETISFGDKASFPGLQGADINAYMAFLMEQEGPIFKDGPEIPSLKAAKREIKAKSPVFRDHLTPELMQEARNYIVNEANARRAFGQKEKPDTL